MSHKFPLVLFFAATCIFTICMANLRPRLESSKIVERKLFRERRERDENCEPELFMRSKECCLVPYMIPMSVLHTCSAGRIQTSDLRKERYKNVREELKTEMIKKNGGPNCFAECMFKNYSLVDVVTGGLNYTAIETKFLASVNNTWKTTMQNAIKKCSALVTADTECIEESKSSSPESKSCECKPIKYTLCMNQFLILNCPDDAKLPGATCSRDLQKLAACDILKYQVF